MDITQRNCCSNSVTIICSAQTRKILSVTVNDRGGGKQPKIAWSKSLVETWPKLASDYPTVSFSSDGMHKVSSRVRSTSSSPERSKCNFGCAWINETQWWLYKNSLTWLCRNLESELLGSKIGRIPSCNWRRYYLNACTDTDPANFTTNV